MSLKPAVYVFAKAPRPGSVKTRLARELSAEAAALLHTAFVDDTLACVSELIADFDIELHTDVPTIAWGHYNFPRILQCGGDLGDRLVGALTSGLQRGHPRVLILGSDSPTLQASQLAELASADEDVALGPTSDGGYYAIASRVCHPNMFDGVQWSDETTREETIRALERCGFSVKTGSRWYDIDTVHDLARLASDPLLRTASRRALSDLGFVGSISIAG